MSWGGKRPVSFMTNAPTMPLLRNWPRMRGFWMYSRMSAGLPWQVWLQVRTRRCRLMPRKRRLIWQRKGLRPWVPRRDFPPAKGMLLTFLRPWRARLRSLILSWPIHPHLRHPSPLWKKACAPMNVLHVCQPPWWLRGVCSSYAPVRTRRILKNSAPRVCAASGARGVRRD